METSALRVFLDVVQRGSFAAVARDRDTDPSTVSRSIAALEQELGIRLLQRSTRRIALTEAGAQYHGRIAPLLEELEHAGEEARVTMRGPSGTLRLTTSVAFGQTRIVPLLPALRRAHPALRLELLLSDARLDLVAERVDLALRMAPRIEGDVVASLLMPTRYHVAASPDYLRRAPPVAAPRDVSQHRCLLSALPEFRTRWRFRAPNGGVREVAVSGDLVTTNAVALRDCALAGLGPALLPDWLIGPDLAEGRLVDPLPDHRVTATAFETGVWIVYPTRALVPAKVRAAIDFLRAHLPGRVAGPMQPRTSTRARQVRHTP
jgi:DNA-binding transcriptional LysR family regulator